MEIIRLGKPGIYPKTARTYSDIALRTVRYDDDDDSPWQMPRCHRSYSVDVLYTVGNSGLCHHNFSNVGLRFCNPDRRAAETSWVCKAALFHTLV